MNNPVLRITFQAIPGGPQLAQDIELSLEKYGPAFAALPSAFMPDPAAFNSIRLTEAARRALTQQMQEEVGRFMYRVLAYNDADVVDRREHPRPTG